jgi:hypothetical protein
MTQVEDLARARDSARNEVVAFIAKVRSLLESQLGFIGDIEREVRTDKSPEREGVEIGKDVGP